MSDGLSQIFPGGFDSSIETELQRIFLDDEQKYEFEQLDNYVVSAINSFITASEDGSYTFDESMLIPSVTPLADAMDMCQQGVDTEVTLAKQDREDYANDYNFLQYLKSI